MASRNKKADKKVQRTLEVLQAEYGGRHPKARIEAYRYNPAAIRIRIIDPDFRKLDRLEREAAIDRILDTLPADIYTEISFLLLLTPQESKASFTNMEFEDPAPAPPPLPL